jgi:hypothetical protein
MKILGKGLRIAYFLNILLIIISFIILWIIYLKNYNFNILKEGFSLLLYVSIVIIGATFGLLFLILNIIILIKYKYIKMIIICLPVLLWVLLSYHFLFFGVLP